MNRVIKIKLIIALAITALFLGLITADINRVAKITPVEYSSATYFDLNSIMDTFSEKENDLFNYYTENGMKFGVDSRVISLINANNGTGINVRDMLETYLEQIFGFDVTLVSEDDPSVDLHQSTLSGKYSEFTYSGVAANHHTVYAYSYNELPHNIYSSISKGLELEIVTTPVVWNYINEQFPSHNLTLADTNGSTTSDDDDLLSEYEVYSYFIDEDYSDNIFLISNNNIYFDYISTYDNLTQDINYYNVNFDSQYTFFGAKDMDTLKFFEKLFTPELMSEYNQVFKNEIYFDIVNDMIQESEFNTDDNLINLLSNLDTIYVGIYEGQHTLLYTINGNYEGYYIELYNRYAELLKYYNINIEYVSYSDPNFDVTEYDNFIYNNFYNLTGVREEYYYSNYSIINQYRIISKSDKSTYTEISEISGKVALPSYLTDYEYLFDILPEGSIEYCESTNICFDMLDNNKVDYLISDEHTVDYFNANGKSYLINLVLHDLAVPGYVAVPNTFDYADSLMELLNILYPTVNTEELYNNVHLTYEKYLDEYNEVNTKYSLVWLLLIFYFGILLIIAITILLDYKKQNSKTVNRIDKLVKVTNIGVLDVLIKNKYLNNSEEIVSLTQNEVQFYTNYNLISLLGITRYSFDKERQRYIINSDDFMNTVVSYSSNKTNSFKRVKHGTNVIDFLSQIMGLEEITIYHNIPKKNDEKYLKYTISHSKHRTTVDYNAIVDDTTHIYKQNELLKVLAYKDSLTRLCNVTKLHDDFNNKTFYHYITLNISNFKFYNDSYSSKFADKLLKIFAEKLTLTLSTKSEVYRIISDDFIIMTKYKDKKEVEALVSSIRKRCSTIQVNSNTKLNIDMYFTITEFNRKNYKDYNQFATEYELKSQISKVNNGNMYISDKEIEDYSFSRNIQGEVFKLKNFKDFEIHLQPKVNPFDSKCVGAETLIRWIHPKHGIISPLLFLDKFEKLERTNMLDQFVLEQTCIAYNKLKEKELIDNNFVISFNLSAQSILETDFVKMITSTLDKYKVSYKNIGVEILESFDLQNHKYLIKSFKELHDLGMKISIDDYGAGYSNVYTVSLLPFTTLKFDKSLLDDIDTDSDKCKLFTDLVSMNRSRGHDLITEGVENQAQVDIIKELNVTQIQGYVYSKPLNVRDFTGFIKDFNK